MRLDEGEAVHARHLDVDQEQPKRFAARHLERLFGRAGEIDLVAGRLQDALLEHARGERVVDDQDRQRRDCRGRARGDWRRRRRLTSASGSSTSCGLPSASSEAPGDDRRRPAPVPGSGRSTTFAVPSRRSTPTAASASAPATTTAGPTARSRFGGAAVDDRHDAQRHEAE